MRDPQRIDRLLEQLRFIWKKYPDMRLGQMLINCVSPSKIYYIEDEDLSVLLEKQYLFPYSLKDYFISDYEEKNIDEEN